MRQTDDYELVFDNSKVATHATEDVVVVHRTAYSGPGGHPVYADDTGIVRAEISDRAEVRMIASGGHQAFSSPVRARPLG